MSKEALKEKLIKQKEKAEREKEKAKQIEARIQAIEAREKARQKEQDRKDDTRRKILAGSFLLKQMEDEAKKTKILADLNEYLTEDRDRKLFDLLNIEENEL